MTGTETHVAQCKFRAYGHTDSAKRCADGVNQAYANLGTNAVGYWMALRLEDGAADRTMYETRRDAVRHQPDEMRCAYLMLTMQMHMPVCEAEAFLAYHRNAYRAGFRLTDPDHVNGGRQNILPRTMADMNRAIAHLTAAGRKRR
jgi:hypothetical protein